MPPKREAGTTATQPPMKILKVDSDVQVFGCDPDEDRYRPSEEASYSAFSNNEVSSDQVSGLNSPIT